MSESGETPVADRPAVPGRRALVWVLVVTIGAAAVLMALEIARRRPAAAVAGGPGAELRGVGGETPGGALPVLLQLPDFRLLERSGRPLGLSDLRGKVWVADFIFTRCRGPCPLLTLRFGELQDTLQKRSGWDQVRLVSFSVDPTHDTPDVLRRYADDNRADPAHWLFLTGSRAEMWQLIGEGFKLGVGEDTDPAMPIYHSTKFVLVDRQGRVRGLYDGLDDPDRARLVADVAKVLAE